MAYITRQKEGNKSTIILRYAALYYWLMWPTIIISILAVVLKTTAVYVITSLCWILLISLAVPYWATISKLKKMMREKSIRARGSKYSFSNPLTYEWED